MLRPGSGFYALSKAAQESLAVMASKEPLPAEIIAAPAVWLASDDSIGVTGAFVSGRDFAERGAEAIKAEHAAK